MLLSQTLYEDFALSEGYTLIGVSYSLVPVEHVKHLYVAQLDLVLFGLSPHQLQFFICTIHIDCVKVVSFLLKGRKLIQKLVVSDLELLDAFYAVAFNLGV